MCDKSAKHVPQVSGKYNRLTIYSFCIFIIENNNFKIYCKVNHVMDIYSVCVVLQGN